jgi:hypothetical protein
MVEAVVSPVQLVLGRFEGQFRLAERRAPIGRPLLEQGP